jgi:VIT1/CCC1 family predicted Fe2+/Mn2+ transporter
VSIIICGAVWAREKQFKAILKESKKLKIDVRENEEHKGAKILIGEKEHFDFWKQYTGEDIRPNRIKIFFYYWIARIFGFTFAIKLMEMGEGSAQETYREVALEIPEARKVLEDEERHEDELIEMLDEKRLNYIGSIVLGLNDALVELTGALAGLSFALQDTQIVAIAGLVTGIAASFSMAASEYLSNKSDGNSESALTSSLYTGFAYIVTVILLILPFLLIANYIYCLIVTILIAIFIIFFFNYYISVAKGYDFKKRFLEMLVISLGVAAISFGIGVLIRRTLGIEV